MRLYTQLQVIHRMNFSILLLRLVLWLLWCLPQRLIRFLTQISTLCKLSDAKEMQRMKCYYDSSVRSVSYIEGEKVLVYNPRKQWGKFAKWQVCYNGPA